MNLDDIRKDIPAEVYNVLLGEGILELRPCQA